ncbi:hypothetical protein [Microbacterium sp. SLBN-146]|uniref:hypothetical protein n=1 Tax=Microbacterium sp. SLBN-146 TaxID=2768457 RepID=UPI0011546AE4|nr:hypothetical protein [Microbacterium sp. SLBN-146]TQJ31956.1 hypothetical protein FBY39_2445 [Microbacterium sp. SLBN-146]
MNTSEYLRIGDAVNLTVTPNAYPYVLTFGDSGEIVTNLTLQGRVIYADALGVCVVTTGGRIMPSSNPDHDLLPAPSADDAGQFFPWRSIDRVQILKRSEAYDAAWLVKFAEEEVYAADHDGDYPDSQREYTDWARTQGYADLSRRIGKVLTRDAELSR